MEGAGARWLDLAPFLTRESPLAADGFEPGPDLLAFLREECRVLVVGAGGLGCELLKDLALSGFGRLDVIDMDSIDPTNLNRQFLFHPEDVGKSKAEVAAARLARRVEGVAVTAHHAAIQDLPRDFYRQFDIIVLGLDSLEARRYMNAVACSFLEYDENGLPDVATVKPLVDGGTEGLKGHARVLLPGITPCFECTLWLFPPQVKFPLCTLAETPRSAEHCIEYAKIALFPDAHPDEAFDADNDAHMLWIYEAALARAERYGIPGVTYRLTQGVAKNIIPAIASTNAFVAAICALEVFKLATLCCGNLDNYLMYSGSDGVYTLTTKYERDEDCPVCGPGVLLEVSPLATLVEVLEAVAAHPLLSSRVTSPSISHGARNLYLRGALESSFRHNLPVPIRTLVGDAPVVLTVNDRRLSAPIKVRLRWKPDGG